MYRLLRKFAKPVEHSRGAPAFFTLIEQFR
jgi:hypothetical protein